MFSTNVLFYDNLLFRDACARSLQELEEIELMYEKQKEEIELMYEKQKEELECAHEEQLKEEKCD